MISGAELEAGLRSAVKQDVLIIEISTGLAIDMEVNVGRMQPFVRLSKPGRTPRSKPVLLMPLLLGDGETQKASDMLRIIADIMAEEGR